MQSSREDQGEKKVFLNEQCEEIEGNNRMGKTRDLFTKTGGNISCKDGHDKRQKPLRT